MVQFMKELTQGEKYIFFGTDALCITQLFYTHSFYWSSHLQDDFFSSWIENYVLKKGFIE